MAPHLGAAADVCGGASPSACSPAPNTLQIKQNPALIPLLCRHLHDADSAQGEARVRHCSSAGRPIATGCRRQILFFRRCIACPQVEEIQLASGNRGELLVRCSGAPGTRYILASERSWRLGGPRSVRRGCLPSALAPRTAAPVAFSARRIRRRCVACRPGDCLQAGRCPSPLAPTPATPTG